MIAILIMAILCLLLFLLYYHLSHIKLTYIPILLSLSDYKLCQISYFIMYVQILLLLSKIYKYIYLLMFSEFMKGL